MQKSRRKKIRVSCEELEEWILQQKKTKTKKKVKTKIKIKKNFLSPFLETKLDPQ